MKNGDRVSGSIVKKDRHDTDHQNRSFGTISYRGPK